MAILAMSRYPALMPTSPSSVHQLSVSRTAKLLLTLFTLMCNGALLPAQGTSSGLINGGQFLDVGGAKLWYEECGSTNSKASLVLLHDGLIHSVTWDDEWTKLCSEYHVVRYDRRGYGRSEASQSTFVPEDDMVKVMRQVHMDHAFVMGCSSGAGLALDFAVAHPAMVDGLLLIGPVVHGMPSTAYFNERGAKNSEPLNRGDIKGAAENWSKDRFLIFGDNPVARKKIYDALAQNPQNLKVDGGLEVRPSPPTVVRLSEIHVPAKILVGEADIADVMAYSGAILAALPVATFEVWDHAGHLIQLEQPQKLVATLERLVDRALRKEVSVSAATLQAYTGEYKFLNRVAKILLKNDHLVLELAGDPYYWLFAASESRFFARTLGAEFEFDKDASGKITEMVILQGGQQIKCPRL